MKQETKNTLWIGLGVTVAFVIAGSFGVGLFLRMSSSTSSTYSSLCPENNGTLSGWYVYDDFVCFYNTTNRRRLFVGSLYRSFS